MLPHLLLNYILHKTGDDFESLLNDIFQNDVKIKNSIYFYKHPNTSKVVGNANSMFFATRYDYLRIAKTMLDDWNNDTCVGQYLKTLHKNKISINNLVSIISLEVTTALHKLTVVSFTLTQSD